MARVVQIAPDLSARRKPGEKDTSASAGAAFTRPQPPAASARRARLLQHIQNKGRPVTTADVWRFYLSWGWRGLPRREVRHDLLALARAGHLAQDNANPDCRQYRPVRTARGGGCS